jgi:multidrug resistance efflux pump
VVAPAVLHPVVEVMASPGDRVKKGQPLVKLDDDEPRADVRSRKAALESAEIALKEAGRHLAASKRAYDVGALPGADYDAARVGALKAEQISAPPRRRWRRRRPNWSITRSPPRSTE